MKGFWVKRKIKKYERRLDEHSDDPEYLQQLGKLYGQLDQQEMAVRYFHETIEAYYLDNLRGRKSNAFIFETCEMLLELEPMDEVAYRTLGQEYCSLGEFAEAAKLYKAFAVKLAKAGEYSDAVFQYRNALVLTPDDLDGRQKCFSILWRLRRKEEAVQELRKIAEIAERMGNISKAVECCQRALKILPSSPEFQTKLRRLVQTHRQSENQLRLVVNNDG